MLRNNNYFGQRACESTRLGENGWNGKSFFIAGLALVVCTAAGVAARSQQPAGPPAPGRPGAGIEAPPGGFHLGWVLPPHIRRQLDLDADQEKQIALLENEVKERLQKILTEAQRNQIEVPRGGPGPLGPAGMGGAETPARPARLKVDLTAPPLGLVKNPRFTDSGDDAKTPAHYKLSGNAAWVRTGRPNEYADRGIALYSAGSAKKNSGSVSQDVSGFESGVGKWFRFSFRGLAEPNFAVKNDGLVMRADFFGKQGANPLDGVVRRFFGLVERDRKELASNGDQQVNGGAVWKTYQLEFRLPFAEIDTLRLVVGFEHGSATTDRESAFYVTEFSLEPIAAPGDAPKVVTTPRGKEPSRKSLIPLGGRWYYDPEAGMTTRPATLAVTAANASRLYYMDGRLTNPFSQNMTAWLHKGNKDLNGRVVEEEQFVPDNVVVEFNDGKTMVVHTRNLPNHATAQFPERFGNPSYIQEHDCTYYLPLEPTRSAKAMAMDKKDTGLVLPMGTIGFAINGVAFFNPFDADMQDATSIMDRCCGHPNPDNLYHYHKYPVCVKSPFVDEGQEHSPVIGWAIDGFPIYGPYEAKGVMAKDSTANALDEFNMHYDAERGWHYHATPGKFPYMLGGFAGDVDVRNRERHGPPNRFPAPPAQGK